MQKKNILSFFALECRNPSGQNYIKDKIVYDLGAGEGVFCVEFSKNAKEVQDNFFDFNTHYCPFFHKKKINYFYHVSIKFV